MALFKLPPELVQLIFDHIVTSRQFARVMRIRIVSRQFKNYIDDSIFRLGLLSHLDAYPHPLDWFFITPLGRPQAFSYAHSYITYQVLREHSTTSSLGRIHQAAKAVCENDGNTETKAVLASINSLVTLAMMGRDFGTLLSRPRAARLDHCSDKDLKADMYIAAIYLGKKSYVESLIANGIQFYTTAGSPDVRSTIFGDPFSAATLQGNFDTIHLLLSCVTGYRDTGALPEYIRLSMFLHAELSGNQAVVNFVLDRGPIPLHVKQLQLTRIVSTPQTFERVAAIIGPDRKIEYHLWLFYSICWGHVQLVRYLLDKGPELNFLMSAPSYSPIIATVRHGHETITRMLLDAGVDPNLQSLPYTALMFAAWIGNLSIVELLLSRVTDINYGHPPPIVIAVFKENMDMFRLLRDHGAKLDTPETGGWAMAVAKLHGLSSMVDVLVHEGVEQDVVLHQVAPFNEMGWWYGRLWP